MRNVMAGLMFMLAVLGSGAVLAADTEGARPAPPAPIILAAGSGVGMPLDDILTLESKHLMALGVGLVAGAALIGPYLGVGELVGIAIGVIGGEIVYRSDVWPLGKPRGWFD